MIDINEVLKYIWLGIVAFIGGVTGYLIKLKNEPNQSKNDKIKLFILGVSTAMFISYIAYEISIYFLKSNGISVALAGLASFTGTDFAVAIEKAGLDFITRKIKNL